MRQTYPDNRQYHHGGEEIVHSAARGSHVGEHLRSKAGNDEVPEPIARRSDRLAKRSDRLREHLAIVDPRSPLVLRQYSS